MMLTWGVSLPARSILFPTPFFILGPFDRTVLRRSLLGAKADKRYTLPLPSKRPRLAEGLTLETSPLHVGSWPFSLVLSQTQALYLS